MRKKLKDDKGINWALETKYIKSNVIFNTNKKCLFRRYDLIMPS